MDPTPPASAPPALNYDVLLNVVAQSGSLRTGLAVMSTCRVLYHDGARILLQNPVKLSTNRGLGSFLYFLRGVPHSRPHHLRELSLDMYSGIDPTLARILGRVCPLMTSLESLRIDLPETVLASDPGLVSGLAKLESLTRLSLSCSGDLVCKLLRLLHAPLKTISLGWGYDDWRVGKIYWETIDEDDWPEYHPTILLENFADTLEELTCRWWNTSEDYIRPRKTFPRFRHLVIEYVDMFYAAPYVQAFPNLARISVYNCIEENADAVLCDERLEDGLQGNHELNIARQLLPAHIHGGTWQRMQEFDGSFFDFYVFGLTCRIRRLVLDAEPSTSISGYLPFLAETLSRTSPTYLKFTTRSANDCDGLEWLSTALREMTIEARSCLNTLETSYEFDCSRPNAGFAVAMVRTRNPVLPSSHMNQVVSPQEDFASAVQQTTVGALKLTVVSYTRHRLAEDWDSDDSSALDRSDPWDSDMENAPVLPVASTLREDRAPRKPPPPLSAAERMVEEFDVAAYTTRLVEALASPLREVEVVIERPGSRGRRVASMARDGTRAVECLEYDK
ncbi:hypothetical protein C8T65DRAFT_743218 [Cerioporus squamosus]|nr:hypothetical protein C8T65DRAFT_743218 [Cerioporus squamosus]